MLKVTRGLIIGFLKFIIIYKIIFSFLKKLFEHSNFVFFLPPILTLQFFIIFQILYFFYC